MCSDGRHIDPHEESQRGHVGSGGAQLSFAQAAIHIGVPLSPNQLDRFTTYRELLLDWNTRHNLTAITDPTRIEQRLFLDALSMIPSIDAYVHPLDHNGRTRLVDVGTGAGFPGLPLKIARPNLEVTLVEATGKKVTFLHRVIEALKLDGVTAIHARAESIGHDPNYRASYDLATARAVASLPALLELCLPLLRQGGRALFPKSPEVGEELASASQVAPMLGGRIVSANLLPSSAPTGEGEPVTRLVIADKITVTPKRYPRRPGIPAREPLGSAAKGKVNE